MSQVDGRQIRLQSTEAQKAVTPMPLSLYAWPCLILLDRQNIVDWILSFKASKPTTSIGIFANLVAAATTPAHGANVVITTILGGYHPQRSLKKVYNL